MSLKPKLDVYPVENYIQSSTNPDKRAGAVVNPNLGARGTTGQGNRPPRRKTPLEKLMSLKARCQEEPCVASVEGVLLAHLHRHPHIILLKQTITRNRDAGGGRVLSTATAPQGGGKADGGGGGGTVHFRLPGGRCRRGEGDEACLLRKLGRLLLNEAKTLSGEVGIAPPSETVVEVTGSAQSSKAAGLFRIGEVLAKWYRPHFSPLMYPYIPSHIATSDVKEVRTIFLVHLKSMSDFYVAPDIELVAVPLFDLYENTAKYGPVIASLPAILSRILINYCSSEF
ncbi:unnamed protein product [Phytomonas sp. Hart1]|nr:unnamed protein product [Phytomonas sp. Hart1]|eukprot:CCW70216.1 unnamed protein product [Phytomonas sp. isolate Hart1]